MRRGLSHLLPHNYPGNARRSKSPSFLPRRFTIINADAPRDGCYALRVHESYQADAHQRGLIRRALSSERLAIAGFFAGTSSSPETRRFVRRETIVSLCRAQQRKCVLSFNPATQQRPVICTYIRRRYNISALRGSFSGGDSALSKDAAPLYALYRDGNVKRGFYMRTAVAMDGSSSRRNYAVRKTT